jgi:hypothetical protein
MRLFGGHADVKNPAKLLKLLADAVAQQPAILTAFLVQESSRAEGEAADSKGAKPFFSTLKTCVPTDHAVHALSTARTLHCTLALCSALHSSH